jgi:hypothetical protein
MHVSTLALPRPVRVAVSRGVLTLVVILISLLVSPRPAAAHEHREVGEYEFSVGFMNEPALVNEPNGLILEISKPTGEHAEGEEGDEGEAGTPVEGLEETLEAEIAYGGETKPLELRPVFNTPGAYTADVIPTAIGAYTFRIFGSLDGTEIDESFTSGPETFAEVTGTDAIAFPAAGGDTAPSSAALDAEEAADSARTLAIVGIGVGFLGLAAGAAGLLAARNARTGHGRGRGADTDWGA